MQPHARLLLVVSTALASLIACGDDEPGNAGGAGSTGTSPSTTNAASTGADTTDTTAGTGGTGGGDASGSPASTTGSGGDGGAGGSGTGGEAAQGLCSGGPVEDPLPVPGCESLVWVGDPVLLDAPVWPRQQTALLDGGDVGLLYVDESSEGPVVSRRIVSPFAVWPPTMTDAVMILPESTWAYTPGFSARSDGTFSAYTAGHGVVGAFGEAGVGLTHGGGFLALDPRAGAGGYLVQWSSAEYFDSVADGASGVLVHTFDRDCQEPHGFVNDDGELMLVFSLVSHLADQPGCGGAPDDAALVRVRPDGGEDLGVVELGAPAWSTRLVPRPGGAWLTALLVAESPLHLCVVPLDADGAVAGPALRTPSTRTDMSVARRGAGLAFAMRGDDGHAVGVTDGVHVTRSPAVAPEYVSPGYPADVVASSDGRSVLATFRAHAPDGRQGIVLARADCVASSP